MGPWGAAVSLGCDPDFVKRTRGRFSESYRINEKIPRLKGRRETAWGGGGGTET